MKTEVQFQDGKNPDVETTGNVTLVVGDSEAHPNVHLEVKITDEGLIVEMWDNEAGEFLPVMTSTFDELFEDAEYDEDEEDEETVPER